MTQPGKSGRNSRNKITGQDQPVQVKGSYFGYRYEKMHHTVFIKRKRNDSISGAVGYIDEKGQKGRPVDCMKYKSFFEMPPKGATTKAVT